MIEVWLKALSWARLACCFSDAVEKARPWQATPAFEQSTNWAPKLNVGVGYRYLWTVAEVETQSYIQNRFTISMNYNF